MNALNPSKDLAIGLRAVRAIAREHTGADDDATCLRVATLLWLGELNGFHRVAPDRIPELELDEREPLT